MTQKECFLFSTTSSVAAYAAPTGKSVKIPQTEAGSTLSTILGALVNKGQLIENIRHGANLLGFAFLEGSNWQIQLRNNLQRPATEQESKLLEQLLAN